MAAETRPVDDVLSMDERTEEMVRFVVDALVEEMAVVEAYGNVLAIEVVAVKYADTTSPTTESLANGLVVPTPTFPPKKTAE